MTAVVCNNIKRDIRPSSLAGVPSPFVTLAQYFKLNGKLREAREILKLVAIDHWQYEETIQLNNELYELELAQLRSEILALRLKVIDLSPITAGTPRTVTHSEISESNPVDMPVQNPSTVTAKTPITFSYSQQFSLQRTEEEQKKEPKKLKYERPMKLHS